LQEHAVVVVEIKQSKVFLLDPKRGEIEMLEVDFDQEWNTMRRVAILVK
jgi:ABC-type bacteriocin/lantibiotic exporter with double-glycine peptidase domain